MPAERDSTIGHRKHEGGGLPMNTGKTVAFAIPAQAGRQEQTKGL
jgi:hypothetical protein